MSEAFEFLDSLFGYKPDHLHVLIWTAQDKHSRWFCDLEQAARYAERRAPEYDVYFGVALAAMPYGESVRLKRGHREAAGIYGMWADLDIAGSTHNELKRYPASEADALRVIEDMGQRPSLIVHSGGGLHVHWLLKEPWIFDTDEEREEARILCWRWKETLKRRAKDRGWDVDSVSDLERVLRVPGTLNHKQEGNPQRVRMLR